jgi:hypothetical protein
MSGGIETLISSHQKNTEHDYFPPRNELGLQNIRLEHKKTKDNLNQLESKSKFLYSTDYKQRFENATEYSNKLNNNNLTPKMEYNDASNWPPFEPIDNESTWLKHDKKIIREDYRKEYKFYKNDNGFDLEMIDKLNDERLSKLDLNNEDSNKYNVSDHEKLLRFVKV